MIIPVALEKMCRFNQQKRYVDVEKEYVRNQKALFTKSEEKKKVGKTQSG